MHYGSDMTLAQAFQEFACGKYGKESTLVNAMTECEAFGISKEDAAKEVMRVIEVVNTGQTHFAQAGVFQEDIDSLALRIDGDFLLGQRQFGKTIAQYKPSNVGA